jgi:HlyD family secretion protein
MNAPLPPALTGTPLPAAKAAAATSPPDLQALLGTDHPPHWWARPALWIGLAIAAAIAGGIYYWQAQKQSQAAPVFVTEAVRKGNLTLTVSANGTIVPTRVVNIGSELSGTVQRVRVDVNDVVKKGQVLVELDTAKLDDQVARSRAALTAHRPSSRRPAPPSKRRAPAWRALRKSRACPAARCPRPPSSTAPAPRWTAPWPCEASATANVAGGPRHAVHR